MPIVQTKPKPLGPAPTEHEVIEARKLDGILCDADGPFGTRPETQWRGCPQYAYTQIRYMDDDQIMLGDLYFCAHHYAVNQIAIELSVSLGRARIIVDERERLLDGLDRKDISA